jgi:hypothetical protein
VILNNRGTSVGIGTRLSARRPRNGVQFRVGKRNIYRLNYVQARSGSHSAFSIMGKKGKDIPVIGRGGP